MKNAFVHRIEIGEAMTRQLYKESLQDFLINAAEDAAAEHFGEWFQTNLYDIKAKVTFDQSCFTITLTWEGRAA